MSIIIISLFHIVRVGIHPFGKMSLTVAEYFKLPNSKKYTENCFRRSSGTLAADVSVDLAPLINKLWLEASIIKF